MRLKIYKFIFFCILLFVIFELLMFFRAEGNTSIVVYGQFRNDQGKSLLLINNVIIDTVYLNHPFAYMGNNNLSFGKNDITIKEIEANIEYNTSITFIGVFTWHTFDIGENNKLIHRKYYYPPRLE